MSAPQQIPAHLSSAGEAQSIPVTGVRLIASLRVPEGAQGVAIVPALHGGTHRGRRYLELLARLHGRGLGTLLVELVTPEELAQPERAAQVRRDELLLARRVAEVKAWLATRPGLAQLPCALFEEDDSTAPAPAAHPAP